METPREPLAVALDARAKGLVAIPCRPGTKVPLVKWKPWQTQMPPLEVQMEWFRDTRNNVALITTGMVLFDVDAPELVDLVLRHCGPTPHVVRTPRGGTHLGYRARKGVAIGNQVKIQGRAIDIRTNGGIEVIPPSVTEHGAYSGLPQGLRAISELPVARVGWTRERKRRRVRSVLLASADLPCGQGRIRNPEAYCLRIESVQGENGSRALVRVVCLLRDAGRTPQQIFDFMMRVWNPACARPEWSEREVWHAIGRHCRGA